MTSPESTRALPRFHLTSLAWPEVFSTGLTIEEAEFGEGGSVRPPFSASRFTVAPGGSTPPDTHAVAECWFVASGAALLVYDGQEIALRQGDIAVFAPNKTHQAFNEGNEALVVFSTWWDVDDRP